ncbi:AMP-binding protein [Salipiger thiooxidans]|nr:AMP-binding protein [Salipiger thiooxidans]
MIVSAMHVEKVNSIRSECPTLEHLIVIGNAPEGWLSLETLCAEQDGALRGEDVAPFAATDTMMIYFTSGTTALPKMVPRNFGYALAHASTGLFWMDPRGSDVHWTLTDTGWAKAAWGGVPPRC